MTPEILNRLRLLCDQLEHALEFIDENKLDNLKYDFESAKVSVMREIAEGEKKIE